jgi:hypothetical protein
VELEGHPTQDIIEELERRGAVRVDGSSSGPQPDAIRFIVERFGDAGGFWLFLPYQAFMTDVDEIPR